MAKQARARAGHLFHESAALELLGGLPETRSLVPRLFGVDPGAEVEVLEDLGSPEAALLGRILDGTDCGRAERGLSGFLRALARIHVAARGREEEYRTILDRFPAAPASHHKVHLLTGCLGSLTGWVETAGAFPARGFGAEVSRAIREIADPGPFLTLTHGDGTVGNCFAFAGRTVVIDLETAGYRHALLDGSFGPLRYLHSVWAGGLPADVRRNLEDAYREELAKGIPEAGEEDRYRDAFLGCCLAWTAGILALLPGADAEDRRWGRSTLRQRILAALDHFPALARDRGGYPAAAETLEALGALLRDRWPPEVHGLSPSPVFGEEKPES